MKIRLLLFTVLLLMGGVITSAQEERDLTGANCALTPDQILGQAFVSTAGAEGDVADAQSAVEGDLTAEELAITPDYVLETLQYATEGDDNVAILVVDDFSSEPYPLDLEDAEPEDFDVSHGWLVLHVLETLYSELPEVVQDHITIEPVNTTGEEWLTSEGIAEALTERIDTLTAAGYDRFVINMSFVFIPCQDSNTGFDYARFLERRGEEADYSLIEALGGDPEYMRDVLTDPRIEAIDDDGFEVDETRGNRPNPPREYNENNVLFLRLLEDNRLQNDPLRTFFQRAPETVIPVASAGNFKLTRPLYPARWQEVLSVSATEGPDAVRWSNSSNGEVSAPGAWFLFPDEAYRAGTSFAAPVVSLMQAIDLTNERPLCTKRGPRPELGSGNFDNAFLPEAAEDTCR